MRQVVKKDKDGNLYLVDVYYYSTYSDWVLTYNGDVISPATSFIGRLLQCDRILCKINIKDTSRNGKQ